MGRPMVGAQVGAAGRLGAEPRCLRWSRQCGFTSPPAFRPPQTLLAYQPPLPTNVRGYDGDPVQTFARERRVDLSYDEYPPLLVHAFISAEDKDFFHHHGIDYSGFIKAVFNYTTHFGRGGRVAGGSTITQQVAKYLLRDSSYNVGRKAREAILAFRLEDTLSKEQILELYLNSIFLGRNAYGVQAAARAYFDKDVDELTLPEAAYLAILPKAPSNYDPVRATQKALDRRNYVLREMYRNGYITEDQWHAAAATPLGTIRYGSNEKFRQQGGYFMEEVRRELIKQFGEDAKDGPNSLYSGGLWVRTSMDPEDAGRRGAGASRRPREVRRWQRLERPRHERRPVEGLGRPARSRAGRDRLSRLAQGGGAVEERRARRRSASRTGRPANAARFRGIDAGAGRRRAAFDRAEARHGHHRQADGPGSYELKTVPCDLGRNAGRGGPHRPSARDAGRVRRRRLELQPRDPGASPAGLGVQADRLCDCASERLHAGDDRARRALLRLAGRRASGRSASSTSTTARPVRIRLRWGLEQSRNLMTVRAAANIGMPKITDTARKLGVGDYRNYLSIALGAGDTTVLRLTNAYAILANQGRSVKPTTIDYVEDRNGKVIYRTDNRCALMGNCNAPDWNGGPMPRPPSRTRQLVDPMAAFQMVHVMEGVIIRGTATVLRDLNRPLFGKTGTTNGPTNVWFVGGTPDIVAGVYLGYDQPRPMGGWAQGGRISAPIWKQWALTALKDEPKVPFVAPPGIRWVRIDRASGKPVFGAFPTTGRPEVGR